MKCPFCASQVDDDAVVCKFCRRDISIQKPLIEANRLLEIKVESLETELSRLTAQLASRDLSSAPLANIERASSFLAIYLLLPIATLVAFFVALVVVLDGHYLWLRFTTVIAAAAFGFVLEYRRRPPWFVKLWFAAILGVTSVLIMAVIQSYVQGVPILSDFLNETSYMISISLGLILGSLIALAIRSLHLPHGERATGFAGVLAVFLAHNLFRGKGVHFEARIERWTLVIRLAAAAVTAAAVIYSGFSKFTQ